MNDGRICVDTDSTVRDDELETDEPEVPEAVVKNLLYTTESLRKKFEDADVDAEAPVVEGTPEVASEQE
jgi:tRNA (guanine-N(7)-)-methyltransferase subunit TRM82